MAYNLRLGVVIVVSQRNINTHSVIPMLPQNKLDIKLILLKCQFPHFQNQRKASDNRTQRQVVTEHKGIFGSGTPKYYSIPIIMFTGSAETPRETDISTSNNRPPIRIANATQSGLNHPCIHTEQASNMKQKKLYKFCRVEDLHMMI